MEALARWRHRERGWIPSADFISVAERMGLIKPLTKYLVEVAGKDAKAIAKTGVGLPVAVNVSMRNPPSRAGKHETASVERHSLLDRRFRDGLLVAGLPAKGPGGGNQDRPFVRWADEQRSGERGHRLGNHRAGRQLGPRGRRGGCRG